jgi:hypothetical protein
MKKLEYLFIESTDIDSGLEFLPKDIKEIKCCSDFPEKKCLEIGKILKLINQNLNEFKKDYYRKENQFLMIIESTSKEIEKIEKINNINAKNDKIRKVSSNIKNIEYFLSDFIKEFDKEKSSVEELTKKKLEY